MISRKLLLAILAFSTFLTMSFFQSRQTISLAEDYSRGRVVMPAPLLVLLHGGDRFLAANFEFIRLSATGVESSLSNTHYLVRAHNEVARLNPCHADNYYFANGLLTWGGAVEVGSKVLAAAIECRSKDFLPPFIYGINLAFFHKNNGKASEMLEVAAQRSTENRAALLKTATVLRAEGLADDALALKYLRQQRDVSADPKLREMLDKRVKRYEGLMVLRAAHASYRTRFGELLKLEQLLDENIIDILPEDPLRLGYELRDGQVELRKLRIAELGN